MNSQLSLGRLLRDVVTRNQPKQMTGVVVSTGDKTVDVALDGDGALLQRRPVVGVMPARGARVFLQEMGGVIVVMSAPVG